MPFGVEKYSKSQKHVNRVITNPLVAILSYYIYETYIFEVLHVFLTIAKNVDCYVGTR